MGRTGGIVKALIIMLFLTLSLSAKTKNNSTLTYSTNPATFMAGSNITPDTPSTFGSFTSYSIFPSPPFYLFFDNTTGILSGIPAASMPAAVYTIKAINNGVVFDTTELTITIVNPPPKNLTYPTNPVNYPIGVTITPNIPTYQGIADSFSISPSLPPGLIFSQISPGS